VCKVAHYSESVNVIYFKLLSLGSTYTKFWRHQLRAVPLWHKGEKTVKQPVYVSDVAAAIVNAIKDPDAVGKTYQAVGYEILYCLV
jgi:nucleoside-diphosphate-sugar epimerase